jgi:hypothetical protein
MKQFFKRKSTFRKPALLLRRFKGIKEPLHPRFLPCCGILLYNPLAGGGIDLFYHIMKRRFGFPNGFLVGQSHELLRAGPYGAFNRLVTNPPFFALPVPLFRGFFFGCHFIPLAYLKSDGRRSVRLHFSHSATFLTFPFSKRVFILISPPQEQKNFWVALVVREFLLV